MKKMMAVISDWLNQGEDVVLATIIADSGSTPRGAGARMALTGSGSFTGTIGGGALEYRIQQMALDALKNKKSGSKTFALRPDDRDNLGMICGGDVTVFIQFVSALDESARELFAHGASLFSKNTDTWLVTDITSEAGWRMGICTGDSCVGGIEPSLVREKSLFSNRGVLVEISGRRYFSEPLTRAGRVIVFGGGHISQELVPLLSHLGFACVLFDDLPKFANKELFPQADSVITGDFNDISAYINITEKDYVVIMTRGHSSDFAVQSQALALKPLYIGAIGSKKKIEGISERLLEQGFSKNEIDRVHSPIGIAIKANTPAEIAVSIAAELIMVRATTEPV